MESKRATKILEGGNMLEIKQLTVAVDDKEILRDDWECPICGANKNYFDKLESSSE